MMAYLWECMLLSAKVALGTFCWSLTLGVVFMIIGGAFYLLFGKEK